jgi:hypothetical protein
MQFQLTSVCARRYIKNDTNQTEHPVICRVLAHWDAEASVWRADSHDVKGLVAEADTLEDLARELRAIVPELLELNHGIDRIHEGTQIVITADRTENLLPV